MTKTSSSETGGATPAKFSGAASAAATQERDDEAASLVAESTTPAAPGVPEPLASRLIEAMLTALDGRVVDERGHTRIGVSQVRNQSRAGSDEFNALCDRLADMLTRAGRPANVHFISDPAAPVHYHVQGAAYLTSSGGFDLWELFLSLTPADQSWTVWEARSPVHVLRSARPGQPQFVQVSR